MACTANSLCGERDGLCTGICQDPQDNCVQFTNGKFGCSKPTNYFAYIAFGVAGLVVFLFLILIIVASFTRSRSYDYGASTSVGTVPIRLAEEDPSFNPMRISPEAQSAIRLDYGYGNPQFAPRMQIQPDMQYVGMYS